MSFDAYLANIREKTGKTPEDFAALAGKAGVSGYRDVLAWLKAEHGLGHGHANLIAQLLTKKAEVYAPQDDKVAALYSGAKAHWRATHDALAAAVQGFGPDVRVAANRTYVNLERAGKKFGILQPGSAARFDVGIKLRGVAPSGRLAEAGAWNAMVTHRVQLDDAAGADDELIGWLRRAYDAAG